MDQQGTRPPAGCTDSSCNQVLANATNRRRSNEASAPATTTTNKAREGIEVANASHSIATIAPSLFPPEVESQEECSICLGPVVNKATVNSVSEALLGRCIHAFCFDCIFKWSETESTCPLCKIPFASIAHYGLNDATAGESDENAAVSRPADRRVVAVEPRFQGSADFFIESHYFNGRHHYFLPFSGNIGLHIQWNEEIDPEEAARILIGWLCSMGDAILAGATMDHDDAAREAMNSVTPSVTLYPESHLVALSTSAGHGVHSILDQETEVEGRFIGALFRVFALFLSATGEHSARLDGTLEGDQGDDGIARRLIEIAPELASNNLERGPGSERLGPEISLEVIPDVVHNLDSPGNATLAGEHTTDSLDWESGSATEFATDSFERGHGNATFAPETIPNVASRNLDPRSNATIAGELPTGIVEGTIAPVTVAENTPETRSRFEQDNAPRDPFASWFKIFVQSNALACGAALLIILTMYTFHPKESADSSGRNTSEL